MTRALHWFRSDLRLYDNTALIDASKRCDEIGFCFVFDDALAASPRSGAARLRFMRDCVERLRGDLERRGHTLWIRSGEPEAEIAKLLARLRPDFLSVNRGTTPYARARDERVRKAAERAGVEWSERKDAVLFEAPEVRTQGGDLYKVYGPYRRAWYAKLKDSGLDWPAPLRLPNPTSARIAPGTLPPSPAMAAAQARVAIPTGGEAAARRRLARFIETGLENYTEDRNRPDIDGTSRLSPYLRFGAISARECVRAATDAMLHAPKLRGGGSTWIDELIWREFYAAQLEEQPRLRREAWRREFDAIRWNDDNELFDRWCRGETGFPIVDAGMRQLAQSGWMHNRVRMITASFLSKDLLIDWRRGEAWFHAHLLDADPASNNGGWQWCASTGADAQPYFRIFNPTLQGRRFDPEGRYVKRWLPELRGLPGKDVHNEAAIAKSGADYPAPCVDHSVRRELALTRYKKALASAR